MINSPDRIPVGKKIGLAVGALLVIASTYMPFITGVADAATVNKGNASIPTTEPYIWPEVPHIKDLYYLTNGNLIVRTENGTVKEVDSITGDITNKIERVDMLEVYNDSRLEDDVVAIQTYFINSWRVMVFNSDTGYWNTVMSDGEIKAADINASRVFDHHSGTSRNLITVTKENGQIFWGLENRTFVVPKTVVDLVKSLNLEPGEVTRIVSDIVMNTEGNEDFQEVLDRIDDGTKFFIDENGNFIVDSPDWYAMDQIDIRIDNGVSGEVVSQDDSGRVAAILNTDIGGGRAYIAFGDMTSDAFGGASIVWDHSNGSGTTDLYYIDPLNPTRTVKRATFIGAGDGFVTAGFDEETDHGHKVITVSARSVDENWIGFAYPKEVAKETEPVVDITGDKNGPTRVVNWQLAGGDIRSATVGMIYGDVYDTNSNNIPEGMTAWDVDVMGQGDYLVGDVTAAFNNGLIADYDVRIEKGETVYLPQISTNLLNAQTGEIQVSENYWGEISDIVQNPPKL